LDKARHTQPRSQLEPGNEGRRMLPWGQVADRESGRSQKEGA
jgi:hypothetical protein